MEEVREVLLTEGPTDSADGAALGPTAPAKSDRPRIRGLDPGEQGRPAWSPSNPGRNLDDDMSPLGVSGTRVPGRELGKRTGEAKLGALLPRPPR